MALKSIPELVCARLPWLSVDNDSDAITTVLDMQFIRLQQYTQKTEEQVDKPQSYTKLQQLLFVELTAYELLVKKVAETMGGKDGAPAPIQKVLTKTKADVVEAEFTIVKASDGAQLTLDAPKLLAEIKSSACQLARQLNYPLPLCKPATPTAGTDVPLIPFITV